MDRFCISVLLLCFVLMRGVRAQEPASTQKAAATALQFEIAQMGKDCPEANDTLTANHCLAAVEAKTNADFRTFYDSLQSLLRSDFEAAAELNESQAQWEKYSASACEAISAFYLTASIRASAVARCHIQLARSRMQDLDALYNTTLHH